MKMGIIGKSVLLTLSALFCFTSSVFTLRVNLPPITATIKPPVLPPLNNNSTQVGVVGWVVCKSCINGVPTLIRAKPVQGAAVILSCKNNNSTTITEARTDNNGFFAVLAPKSVTSDSIKDCRASLASSPDVNCRRASTLNGEDNVSLNTVLPSGVSKGVLSYNVGILAFEPSTCSN